jgi:hypothetical protein
VGAVKRRPVSNPREVSFEDDCMTLEEYHRERTKHVHIVTRRPPKRDHE